MSDEFLQSVPLNIPDVLLSSHPVMDGEPIDAATTNRLPQVNARNTASIHDLIKKFRDLSGEYLWQMPITSDVRIGDFVYFDAHSRLFDRGSTKFTLAGQHVTEAECAQVWGVVIDIRNDKGDICTSGLCTFHPTTDIFTKSCTPGIRYLGDNGGVLEEASFPYKCVGFLVNVRQSGEVQFFVHPHLSADPRTHQHRSYALSAAPAGDWFSEVVDITNTDINLPGWLPANHAIFEGKAPVNAVYGYNPHFLKGCGWPIKNPSTACLQWQRAASRVPLLATVPSELYHLDDRTIWWFSDTILPWDAGVDYKSGIATVPGEQIGYAHRMWLSVTNTGYDLSSTVVTTLRTNKSGGLYIRQYPYGGQAVSGDLEIGLDLTFGEEIVPDGLGFAVGEIKNHLLRKTPVVSKVRVNSRVLRVQSQHFDGNYHHGALTLSDPTGVMGTEVPIEATHLTGVEEVLVADAVGLAFHQDRPSSLLTQLLVPYDNLFTTTALSVRLGLLTMRPGNIQADILRLSYRIIKNPSGLNKAVSAFPVQEMSPLACNCSLKNAAAHGYFVVESEKIPVSPGDIFIVKIERRPPDGFLDRLVLLRKSGLLNFE
jgi:hypothetical protein